MPALDPVDENVGQGVVAGWRADGGDLGEDTVPAESLAVRAVAPLQQAVGGQQQLPARRQRDACLFDGHGVKHAEGWSDLEVGQGRADRVDQCGRRVTSQPHPEPAEVWSQDERAHGREQHDIVLAGVARVLAPYEDRVRVVEIDTNRPIDQDVDLVLYDSFAQPDASGEEIADVVANRHTGRLVIYAWNFDAGLVRAALAKGARGYLSKTLPARDLVAALEAVHAGEVVVSPPPRSRVMAGLDWPGRAEGLTEREAEVLALITQGRGNADIAAICHLSPNTVKSYIRGLYRKIGVTSRSQAVLWGVAHGFLPDFHRIQSWQSER